MKHFYIKINGIPYCRNKQRGKTDAPSIWTEEIIRQTENLPKVEQACIMKVTFLLPNDKFPPDLPFGSDLDNLLKRFLDALNKTIFSDTPGKDSCVISMCVSKTKVDSKDEAGALLEILPVSVHSD
jgi:Holliday junction resolvase RusA-like endonuclease